MPRLLPCFLVALLAVLCACSETHGGEDGGGADTSVSDTGGTDTGGGDTGGVDWGACETTSECTVARNICCSGCPFDAFENLDGVNTMHTAAHMAEVCPDPTMSGCEPCPIDVDALAIPGYFSPCRAGRCVPVDIILEPMTECEMDVDCRVRTRDCCECGADLSDANLTAIRTDAEAAFTELVCDVVACDDCAPIYPSEVVAVCDMGRCRLGRAMSGP